jgi:tellurite methyltransferase
VSWPEYWNAVAGRPPRPTLLFSLERFGPRRGFAVDLGCGEGRDAIELLRRGWRVLCIDAEEEAVRRLRERPDLPEDTRLETLVQKFEDASWPAADLVNASFSLPFCPPDRFPELWQRIRESLLPGGRFCGQLLGERDEWAGRPGLATHRRVEVEALLDGLAVEKLEEEEEDGKTALGRAKHWHIFNVVACRV